MNMIQNLYLFTSASLVVFVLVLGVLFSVIFLNEEVPGNTALDPASCSSSSHYYYSYYYFTSYCSSSLSPYY